MRTWEEELQAYRRRTKKSARAWESAKRRIPFGVNSNYRVVDPYPMYVRQARGSRLWDLDGDPKHPNVVPSSKGLLKELVETAIVAPFNDVDATESLALLHRDDVAGIILEPVPMNMGYVQPEPGFLEGVRAVADEVGAILIFDEVKTCGKWYGGAEEAFQVTPDVKVLGKAIGGGFPLAAVRGKASILDQVIPGQISHAGTFNANPLSISAGGVGPHHKPTPPARRPAAGQGNPPARTR